MISIPKKYLKQMNINGMSGRVLDLPKPEGAPDEPILLIYGHHSSLERMYTTAQSLNTYGRVIMPDLPGFGGMDSLFSIGEKPSIDRLADYMYTLLKSQRLTSEVKVFAMSFGFLVYTRMLQKYPASREWPHSVISFVGFGRRSDFEVGRHIVLLSWIMAKVGSTRLGALLLGQLFGNKILSWFFMRFYSITNPKTKDLKNNERQAAVDMEVSLWRSNDPRTHFYTLKEMIGLDLVATAGEPLSVPLYDMFTPHDQYFNHKNVNATLRLLYKEVHESQLNMELHAPSVIATAEEASAVVSDEVKELLGGAKLV